MKAKLTFKSKRTIITVAIIVIVAIIAMIAGFAYVKSNSTAQASTDSLEVSNLDNSNYISNENLKASSKENENSIQKDNTAEEVSKTNTDNTTEETAETNNTSSVMSDADENNSTTSSTTNSISSSASTTTSTARSSSTSEADTRSGGGATSATTETNATVTYEEVTENVIVEEPWETHEVEWVPENFQIVLASANLEETDITSVKSYKTSSGSNTVSVGDTITYYITVTNNLEKEVDSLYITDEIPKGTTFVEDSITKNGIAKTNESGEVYKIVWNLWNLGLGKDESIIVSFTVKVVNAKVGTVINVAFVEGEETNKVNNPIIESQKSVAVYDSDGNVVSGNTATYGDILEYTITVTNKSESEEAIVKVKDAVPEGTTFVADSIKVNGEITNYTEKQLNTGIDVKVASNGISFLNYKVKINNDTNLEEITNIATVNGNDTNEVKTPLSDQKVNINLYAQTTTSSSVEIPMDVVFILDTSESMVTNDVSGSKISSPYGGTKSRAYAAVSAINSSIDTILKANEQNRIAVVAFSSQQSSVSTDAEILLPLEHYTAESDGTYISFPSKTNSDTSKIKVTTDVSSITAKSRAFAGYTYMQWGWYEAYAALYGKGATAKVSNGDVEITVTRTPVVILVTDGEPTIYTTDYNNVSSHPDSTHSLSDRSSGTSGDSTLRTNVYRVRNITADYGYYTILSANYYKNLITNYYYGDSSSNKTFVYSIGEGIVTKFGQIVIDPSNITKLGISSVKPGSSQATLNYVANSTSENEKTSQELYYLLKNQSIYNDYDYVDASYSGNIEASAITNQIKTYIDNSTYKLTTTTESTSEISSKHIVLTNIDINKDFALTIDEKSYNLSTALSNKYVVLSGNTYYVDLNAIGRDVKTISITYYQTTDGIESITSCLTQQNILSAFVSAVENEKISEDAIDALQIETSESSNNKESISAPESASAEELDEVEVQDSVEEQENVPKDGAESENNNDNVDVDEADVSETETPVEETENITNTTQIKDKEDE